MSLYSLRIRITSNLLLIGVEEAQVQSNKSESETVPTKLECSIFFFSWSLSFSESNIESSVVPAFCRAVDTDDAAEVAKRGRRRRLLAKASFPDDVRSSRSTSFSKVSVSAFLERNF